jgi:hypothetical protein
MYSVVFGSYTEIFIENFKSMRSLEAAQKVGRLEYGRSEF